MFIINYIAQIIIMKQIILTIPDDYIDQYSLGPIYVLLNELYSEYNIKYKTLNIA